MKNRGLMFFVLYCATMCMSLSQFKIVPILSQLTENLGITYAQSSWMMSVFTIAAIILAIPIGGIVAKVGPKKSYITVLIIMVLGNVLGGFAIDNYPLLLFSRILEGCAFAIWNIAGVTLINMWYPDKNNGLFIGTFMTFAAIASFIMLNVAVPISNAVGMTSLWWGVAILTIVFTGLFALVVKEAPMVEQQSGIDEKSERGGLGSDFTKRGIWALCISQLIIGFVLYFFLNNYPSLFTACYGLDQGVANFYGSLNGLFGIPGCILGGFILDRLGKEGAPKFVVFCFIVIAVVGFATAILAPWAWLFVLHTLLTAVFPGLVLTANNYLVPKCVSNPKNTGLALGVLTLFYNVGIFIGSPIIMYAVEGSGSWMMASYVLLAVGCIGLVAAIAYMAIAKKSASAQA